MNLHDLFELISNFRINHPDTQLSDEIYTLNHKSQVKRIQADVVYECYRTNGSIDLPSHDDWIKIKKDKEYCDATYLNIDSANITLLVY